MKHPLSPRTARALLAACAVFAIEPTFAADAPSDGRTESRQTSNDRTITPVDPPARDYQRPMTPEQKKQQAAYEASRRCYARFATRKGGLKPGAEKACGPALKDPSASP